MRTCSALLLGVLLATTARGQFDPTAAYKKETVEGFTLLFNPTVSKDKARLAEVKKELAAQLKHTVKALPAEAVVKLKEVQIWVEWERDRNGSAIYHPSEGWLTDNGYNPDKAEGVEVSNARNLVLWSRTDQPCLLLGALAQVYHHKVVGLADEGVQGAYKQAMSQKLYDAVPYIRGGMKQKAPAAADDRVYFAELTKAYFGRNNYYPFARADLEKHDPAGFKMIETAWGVPAKKKK